MSTKKIVLTLIILLALGIFSYVFTRQHSTVTGNVVNEVTNVPNEPRTINVQATRWQYNPSEIRVKKGEPIKIIIDNVDTTHGILIPDLGLSGIETIEFTPNRAGTFNFRCPTMCGQGHRNMTGNLIVEE